MTLAIFLCSKSILYKSSKRHISTSGIGFSKKLNLKKRLLESSKSVKSSCSFSSRARVHLSHTIYIMTSFYGIWCCLKELMVLIQLRSLLCIEIVMDQHMLWCMNETYQRAAEKFMDRPSTLPNAWRKEQWSSKSCCLFDICISAW